MRSSVLRLCVIPLFGSVTTAATITSCSVNSGMLHESQSTTIDVGSTTCSVTPNPPPQMAAAAASVRISGNQLATSVQGSVQAPVNAAGNATISASIDPAALYTDGPLRSGIVRISWFLQSSFGPRSAECAARGGNAWVTFDELQYAVPVEQLQRVINTIGRKFRVAVHAGRGVHSA